MKRDKPLQRRTQLRAKSPLRSTVSISRSSSLKGGEGLQRTGVTTQRKLPYQDQEREAVLRRSGRTCEYHRDIAHKGQHLHHVFGRGNVIGEPWASSRYLTTWICSELHQEIHDGRNKRAEWLLRWEALSRLIVALNIQDAADWKQVSADHDNDPVAVLRYLERAAEEHGWSLDQVQN